MGREAMIRADMESVGLYSPIYDGTIRQLAKTERELSRAEKTWKSAGGKMVAKLVNKTGATYTAKDPNYAVVDQLRKDVLALRTQLGLTPTGFARAKRGKKVMETETDGRLESLLTAAREHAVEHAAEYSEQVDGYVSGVLSGELLVCEEIRQACQRYIDDLASGKWEFRAEPANEIIAIIETMICHQKGQFLDATPLRGTPFYLLPYHKFIVYNIMGFYVPGTQERRFKERQENPDKQWKITEEDWRNRAKWDQYEVAVDEMLVRTSTTYAPWIIVEANSKYYARIKVLKTVVGAIEDYLKTHK